MKKHNYFLCAVGSFFFTFFCHADNLFFNGALIAEPCVIAPGEENIVLDFGTVIDKYLYLNTRTHGKKIEINLRECDLSLGTVVRTSFKGKPNLSLPGFLATNQDMGIGIGLETVDGVFLPLDTKTENYNLTTGTNIVSFKAFVQGEPNPLSTKTLVRGPFSAIATFYLEYE